MTKDKVFQLNQTAVEKLAEEYGTPLLVLSLDQVKANYDCLKKYIPRLRIFYAMKANPNPEILKAMAEIGSSFDVASAGEIRTLNEMGVSGERLIYANPVKLGAGFQACRDCGVTKMTFDSASEIEKMQKELPGATVLLRLRIDNSSALVDLNKKFGAGRERAVELMLKAKEAGLDLRIMDIGGGFPIPTPSMKFNLPEMLKQISARLDEDFPGIEIWAEPGRYICGTAVDLITSVIGVTERGGQPWYFLDDGLYGTFSGVIFDQWDFKLISFKEGDERVAATFAGPSCDSLDIMFRGRMTVPLEVGDLLLVPSCGAYTSASATTFNGFSKAQFIVWDNVKDNY
ncbi:MAG: type III PLP-dependent enzyme [Phascolarctobacterium sp.]|nr:type III PLP-dependent enzyme [Phascolarctobacterium sp.]